MLTKVCYVILYSHGIPWSITTRKHIVAEVYSVTKLGKIFKKTSATTSSIHCGGFNRGYNLKKLAGRGFRGGFLHGATVSKMH